MKISAQSAPYPTTGKGLPRFRLPQRQRGVVLVIALILLVVISLLAVTSIRNASSTANVAGNVRTTELATQAADIALRHCEASILDILRVAGGKTSTYPSTFKASDILQPSTPPTPLKGQDRANWDSASTPIHYVLPLNSVNQTGMTDATYKRQPECMAELTDSVAGSITDSTTHIVTESTTTYYVVTARGFGPEVEAGNGRPVGSEIWLQSNISVLSENLP